MSRTAKSIVFDNFEVTPEMLKSIGITQLDDQWLLDTADTLARAKGEWLDGLMRANLPAEIFDCARSEHGDKRMKAQRFIAKEGFQLKEHPNSQSELWKNDQLLGQFKVEIKDGKIQCLVTKGKA